MCYMFSERERTNVDLLVSAYIIDKSKGNLLYRIDGLKTVVLVLDFETTNSKLEYWPGISSL